MPSEILTKGAMHAWKLIGLIALIVLAVIKIVDIDNKLATAAAQNVMSENDRLLKAHLQESERMQEWMRRKSAEDKADFQAMRSVMEQVRENVISLCAANPHSRCK